MKTSLRIACLAAILTAGAAFCAPAAFAGPERQAAATATDLSAQRRARVTVYPRRRTALGPNAVRQCRTRLEQEHRPSGTVIFPRMYCWWE